MTYKVFPKYVLRAPLFSFSFYKGLTKDKEIVESELKQICSNKTIQEAIFLASPSLFEKFGKWLEGKIKDPKESERMTYTVLKYLSRMSSRCTPFGLFAGTSLGTISENTEIELKDRLQNKRHTRLDMNYLVVLSQDIVKEETIRKQLLFYPNTSIYQAGDQLRYIEYAYENSRRWHHIAGVAYSEYIERVLSMAESGALLEDLAKVLVEDEITIEDAMGFIDQLVENQLLISELEPSVSGPEFLNQLLPVLKKMKDAEGIVAELEKTHRSLDGIDQKIGNDPQDYIQLSESLKILGTGFDLKFMFQTDMGLSNKKNTLSKKLVYKVKRALSLLNKITLPPQQTLIDQFRSAFYDRYEYREVPLSKALDVELGIGFLQKESSGDVSVLIDDLILPQEDKRYQTKEVKHTPIHAILQKRLLECIANQQTILVLEDKDFNHFEENWEDLPDTFSTLIEIVKIDQEEKIIMSGSGGSSAVNLIGRFCHGDEQLNQYAQEIANLEEEMNRDKILAEIVHLPESRVGNILMRPAFRKYEIPYLAKSVLSKEHQLSIDDLLISLQNSKQLKIRSKKYNKEVKPNLSNAHNYTVNALPTYQFLANMQTQNLRGGIGFNWGPFEESYGFLPRVEYKDVILSSAIWNIVVSDIKSILDTLNNQDQLTKEWNGFTRLKKIPQFVLLVDGDNELLINTRNITSVKMLLNTIKGRKKFKIKEFLHTEDGIVKQGKETYTNQIVLSFYNHKKLKNGYGKDKK